MKKRLFIAVDISDEARSAAQTYIDLLTRRFQSAPVKWERSENLHLTLKFLGSTGDDLVPRIVDLVRQNAKGTKPFEIEISGTGAFPSAKNPRILWLGAKETCGTMKHLAELIDQECSTLGFEKETRSFKSHLTIARVRYPRGAADLGREHSSCTFGPIRFTCSDIVLYESKLGRGGSVYSKLATAKFSDT